MLRGAGGRRGTSEKWWCRRAASPAPAVFADGPVSGQTVLVHGVRGSVSSLAAQLARWAGATVIGTVRADAETGLLDAGTADHVVSLQSGPAGAIRRLALATSGRQVIQELAECPGMGAVQPGDLLVRAGRGDDFGGHTPDFNGSPEGCRSGSGGARGPRRGASGPRFRAGLRDPAVPRPQDGATPDPADPGPARRPAAR